MNMNVRTSGLVYIFLRESSERVSFERTRTLRVCMQARGDDERLTVVTVCMTM